MMQRARCLCKEEKPAAADHWRVARSRARRPCHQEYFRRFPHPVTRQWPCCRYRIKGRHQARADSARAGRLPFCLDDCQACEIQRHRLCQGCATAGIGAGQMNRRDSARIAAIKAKEAAETYGWADAKTVGSAVASDAFFPFADGLLTAAEAGATAVIQPGRINARRRSNCRCRRSWIGDGVYRYAAFPALRNSIRAADG